MINVIEGLICTVTGSELRHLCQRRVEHHEKRARDYREQAARFGDEPEIPQPGGSNISSPQKTLADSAARHQDQAAEMKFLADHVVAEESYRLDRADLFKLGITKQQY